MQTVKIQPIEVQLPFIGKINLTGVLGINIVGLTTKTKSFLGLRPSLEIRFETDSAAKPEYAVSGSYENFGEGIFDQIRSLVGEYKFNDLLYKLSGVEDGEVNMGISLTNSEVTGTVYKTSDSEVLVSALPQLPQSPFYTGSRHVQVVSAKIVSFEALPYVVAKLDENHSGLKEIVDLILTGWGSSRI